MPYFWETRTWSSRLKGMKIEQPPGSGFYMNIPDPGDGNLHQLTAMFQEIDDPRHLQFPMFVHRQSDQIETLKKLYHKARSVEMFRKVSEMDRAMLVLDRMIHWMKDGGQPPNCWGDVTISDLQAMWYIVRYHLYNEAFDRVLWNDDTVVSFIAEYWNAWRQCIEPTLPEDPSKSILEKLLCFPGIGMANPQPFFREQSGPVGYEQLQAGITKFFTVASNKMQDLHFEFNRLGSMGDGSRIGYCDEFDYRLEFSQFDIVPLLGDDLSIRHVTEVIGQFEPRISTVLPRFMEVVDSLKQEYMNENLQVLGGSTNGTVPYVVFRWIPDRSSQWMLAKVDCTLSIPCHGVWPGSQTLDPLGQPIPQDKNTHLMFPNPSSRLGTEWKWSVCQVQKDFFKSLPKYMQLGFIISKVICSHAFMSEDFGTHTIPSSFCLKNNLFNALSCGDVSIHDDPDSEDQLILDAIPVADAIIAGLEKAQLAYFYEGEPIEHVWHYFPEMSLQRFQNFLPRYILQLLVENHITTATVEMTDSEMKRRISELIPYCLSHNQHMRATTDLELMREILGLPISKAVIDDWGKLARDATKWADLRIAFGVRHMLEDSALTQLGLKNRCLEDLERIRSHLGQWSLMKVHKYLFLPRQRIRLDDFISMTCHDELCGNDFSNAEADLPTMVASSICGPHDTIGNAYDQFHVAFEKMLGEFRDALFEDACLEDGPEREEKLAAIRKSYKMREDNIGSNIKFRFVLSLGRIVDLSRDALRTWNDRMKVELMGHDFESIKKKDFGDKHPRR